jgi:hypothetical protein
MDLMMGILLCAERDVARNKKHLKRRLWILGMDLMMGILLCAERDVARNKKYNSQKGLINEDNSRLHRSWSL